MNEADEDLMRSLVGRTITRTRWFDESPDNTWTHHETAWLWLDDGRVIEFSSYGYDADGAAVSEIELIDVDRCLHCGQPHSDQVVFRASYYGNETAPRYAFCTDGNHTAWRDQNPEAQQGEQL